MFLYLYIIKSYQLRMIYIPGYTCFPISSADLKEFFQGLSQSFQSLVDPSFHYRHTRPSVQEKYHF